MSVEDDLSEAGEPVAPSANEASYIDDNAGENSAGDDGAALNGENGAEVADGAEEADGTDGADEVGEKDERRAEKED